MSILKRLGYVDRIDPAKENKKREEIEKIVQANYDRDRKRDKARQDFDAAAIGMFEYLSDPKVRTTLTVDTTMKQFRTAAITLGLIDKEGK